MRRYFITGLLIWVPLGITVWVLNLLIGTHGSEPAAAAAALAAGKLAGHDICPAWARS